MLNGVELAVPGAIVHPCMAVSQYRNRCRDIRGRSIVAKHRYQSIPLDQKLEWLSRVPNEIAKVRQWLTFKLEVDQDGEYDKVPYYADGGKRYGKQGRPDDLQRLVQLADAIERMRKGKADGVGFAPIEHGAASAIDFDGAESVARNAATLAKTWSEVSVGGIGAHAFVLGDLESNHKARSIGIELFSTSGFVAVTGEPLVGCEDVGIKGKRVARSVVAKITNGRPHAHVTGIGEIRNIPTPYTEREREKILDAFKVVKCKNVDYDQWLMVGQALHSADPEIEGPAYAHWLKWSKRDPQRFKGEEDLEHRWRGFKGTRGITLATLYGFARDIRAKRHRAHAGSSDITKFGDVKRIDFGTSRIFIEGLIAEGLTLLTGQKKLARKTFWVLQCAALTSVGESFLGHQTVQPLRVVAYMLEEGTVVYDRHKNEVPPLDVVVERINAMGLSKEATNGGLAFRTSLPPLYDGGIEQIEKDAKNYDLILIDSRQMILNEDADRERNVWRRDYQHLLPLREIARKEHCAIVVVNHASKGSDARDAIDAGAATGGIDAAVDGMIVLQHPDKERIERIKMSLHHRRLVFRELELRWNERTHLFEPIGPWLNAGRAADVLGVLVQRTAKKSDEGLSSLQVARYVFGANAAKQRPNVAIILGKLRRDGLVMFGNDGDDLRTRLWRCTRAAIVREHIDDD